MKRRGHAHGACALLVLSLTGCVSDDNGEVCTAELPCPGEEPAVLGRSVRTAVFYDTQAVHENYLDSHVTLTVDLDANKATISKVKVTNLPAGEVVSLWWGILNHPEHCIAGDADPSSEEALCGPEDLYGGQVDGVPANREAVAGVTLYAGPAPSGAMVTDASGVADFGSLIFELTPISPDAPDSPFKAIGYGLGNGLNNLAEAEYHLLVQTHGPELPAGPMRDSQYSEYWGGCLFEQSYEGMIPEVCNNPQIAFFRSPIIL